MSIEPPITGIVIVHIDELGDQTYEVLGDSVRMFIVDERAPSDRVYEWLPRSDAATVKSILANDPIGSSQDERHPALSAVINEALGRGSRLTIVQDDK